MSGIKEGPRFRLFQIQNNSITYDRVIEYEKLHIIRNYSTNNTQVKITINNEEDFSIPLCIYVKFAPLRTPYTPNKGEIIKYTASGDLWVQYDTPIGESEIEIILTK